MSGGDNTKIDWQNLINAYGTYSSYVSSLTSSIGGTNLSTGVSMQSLFQLQLAMNNLSMFGQTLTNVMQGVQEVAMGISRNAKGS